jgi:hypothetical protein
MESGLMQIDGFAKFSPAGVVLEFESKFLGFIKSGVQENAIPLDRLLDVRFRKGFFKIGAKIEIRLKSFTELSKLPNSNGAVVLKIKREDFEVAKEAAERINRFLLEYRQELPPTHTYVSELFEEDTKELVSGRSEQ